MDIAQATGLPDPEEVGRRYICVLVVMAVKADMDFTVRTLTGSIIRGKAGDYIAKDEDGDWAVIPRDKFASHYAAIKVDKL